MKYLKRITLIIVILVSCVGCDQAAKSIAVSTLSINEPVSYFGDTLRFQLAFNRGAFLSMGSSLPEEFRYGVFTVGCTFFLVCFLIYGLLSKPGQPFLWFGIALFFSGGVGNLLDRITNNGLVVDFINLGIGPIRTGIFNIADIAITVGGLIFFWAAFRQKQKLR